jgi:hypothetical protein
MPTVFIPVTDLSYNFTLNLGQSSGITDGILGASGNSAPAVYARPSGTAFQISSGSSIYPNVFASQNNSYLYAVLANKQLYYATSSGETLIGTCSNLVTFSDRSTTLGWTENERYIYIHNEYYATGSGSSDYIYDKSSSTLTEITDADHPIKAGRRSSQGVVYLDGYFFVADGLAVYDKTISSRIYNSAIDDPTTWVATDFISANLEGDPIIAIAKHHNHIVALGAATIQFFYNAGNPSGSPLAPRLDVFHNVGLGTFRSPKNNQYAVVGDNIYFIGVEADQYGRGTYLDSNYDIYVLDNFQIKPITTPSIKEALTRVLGLFDLSVIKWMGRNLLLASVYNTSEAYVYDIDYDIWYYWTISVRSSSGNFILHNTGNRALSSGYIQQLAYYTYGSVEADNSTLIVPSISTPFIDDLQLPYKKTAGKRKYVNRITALHSKRPSTTINSTLYIGDEVSGYGTGKTYDISRATGLSRWGQHRQFSIKYVAPTTSSLGNYGLLGFILDVDVEA